MGTPGDFVAICQKGDYFSSFVTSCLLLCTLVPVYSVRKEFAPFRICSQILTITPLFRRDKTSLTELPTLTVYPFPLRVDNVVVEWNIKTVQMENGN